MSLLQHSQLHQLFQHHNGLNALVQQQQMNELIRSQLGALQDRLQLNIAQQTQLVTQLAHSSDRKLNNGMQLQIQQLVIEQQQLIQQIQLQQRHYLVQQGLSPGISHGDLQKLWQDSLLMDSSSSAKLLSLLSNPLFATALSTGDSRAPDSSQNAKISSHPLYQNGTCMWLSCETPCDSYFAFLQHLSSFHPPDDKASAQLKVQVQILEHLEKQVEQERVRLQAMQSHLQMKQSPDTTTPGTDRAPPVRHASTSNIDISATSPPQSTLSPMPLNELRVSTPTAGSIVAGTSSRTSVNGSNPQPRKRLPDKSTLPIAADIARNREFYKSTDVRPPYTYASLIRQAIMDSDEKQLTLNEIYNWFQDTFAYFRRNAATWKNAVRHNLSLHKCFMRVENVKGAVWTVDEAEFYRRRPQRLTSSTCGPYRQQPPAEVSRHRSLSAFIDHAMNNGTNDGSTTTNGMQFPERSSSSHTPDFSSSRLTDPDEYDAFIKEEYGGHYSPSTKLSRSSQDHKTSNGHPQGLEPEGKFPGEVPRGTYPGGIPAGLLMTNGFYDSAAAGLLAATAAAAAVSLPNTVIVTPGRGQSPGPEEGGLVIAEDQPPTRPLPNDLGDGDDDSTPPTVKREASSHQSN